MKTQKPLSASELRRLADELHRKEHPDWREEEVQPPPMRLLHELQVHQIELELQNEELQQSRAEVEAGLQRYTDLYDFAPIGYLTLDRVGAIVQVNLAGASLLGEERSRLVGGRFLQFVAGDQLTAFNNFLKKVFASQADESCVMSLRRKDQWVTWVHVTARVSEEGLGCLVVMQDITAQHELEEQLHVAIRDKDGVNKLLQAMIDGIEDSVVVVDTGYHVLQMNQAARTNYGTADLAQDGGIACHQLSHRSSEPCGGSDHPCPLTMVLESGKTARVLHTHTRANGDQFPVELVATPIRNAENKVVGIIEVGRDITERLQLDRAEKKLLEQEFRQQKEKTITTLAGGIAHDFNNILMSLLGNAELLQMQETGDTDRKQMTAAIIQGGQRLAHLVRQLQSFAKSDFCQPEELDINTMLRETVKRVPANKSITIDLRLGENLWPIFIDRNQLNQLLRSLISNAMESMEKTGGLMTLSSTNEMRAEKWTCDLGQIHAPGEFVRVVVADTGPGISEDIMPRIFDPFFSTKFVGRGMGLAAVLGIVDRHGGGIFLQTSSQGTTISVLLPKAEPMPSPVHLEPTGPAATLQQSDSPDDKMVLVVDDEGPILQLVKAFLEKERCRVLTAANGKEAEKLWMQHLRHIRLVILDIQLPDINGQILYKRLKELNPALPVIISSGYDREAAIHDLQLQASDIFLPKPYVLAELAKLVQSAVEGKGLLEVPLAEE